MDVEILEIGLDGDWDLLEFQEFFHDFNDLYAVFLGLSPDLEDSMYNKRKRYGRHPWRGGFSTVNFFASTRKTIPRRYRPRIRRITYASPGVLELLLFVTAATAVLGVVHKVIKIGREANILIREIDETRRALRRSKEHAYRADEEYRVIAGQQSRVLARMIGIPDPDYERILDLADGNEVATLQIVKSIFRRAERMAERQYSGQASIPQAGRDLPSRE